ncbi:MAG TPA: Gmad2 immunoglobulin-like domain-containing protein [Desulfitobacteriaceae bacterium]|nr:Gmad2 immunoglobulin-like domain-containing protein [Desulfitobacteriaceae bacterium]
MARRKRDAYGNILAQGFTTASAGAPDRGDFNAELSFTPASVEKG